MEVRRYDGKLDNFLLQTLPEDEYERIATSELCVVVSPEEKPAHKHAIVGHQHLYLTQFPPKNLKIALHLQDVTSVRMVGAHPPPATTTLSNSRCRMLESLITGVEGEAGHINCKGLCLRGKKYNF